MGRARSLETDSQEICGPSAHKIFARNLFSWAVVAPVRSSQNGLQTIRNSRNRRKTFRNDPKTVRKGLNFETVRRRFENGPKTIRKGPKKSEKVRKSPKRLRGEGGDQKKSIRNCRYFNFENLAM